MRTDTHPRRPEYKVCAVSESDRILVDLGSFPSEKAAKNAIARLGPIPNADRIIIYKASWESVYSAKVNTDLRPISNRVKSSK